MKALLEGWIRHKEELLSGVSDDKIISNGWDIYVDRNAKDLQLQLQLVDHNINYQNAEEYLAHPERLGSVKDPNRHSDVTYLAYSDDITDLQKLLVLPDNSTWIRPTSRSAMASHLKYDLDVRSEANNFYIPYCIRENHWITIALKRDLMDGSKFNMTIYNSMGNLESDDRYLLTHIGSIVGIDNVKLETRPVLNQNTQMLRQHDDKTCGYYCLMNAVLDANNQYIEGANRSSVFMDGKVREYFTKLEQQEPELPSVNDFMLREVFRPISRQVVASRKSNIAPEQESVFAKVKTFLFSWYEYIIGNKEADIEAQWNNKIKTAESSVQDQLNGLVQNNRLDPKNPESVMKVAKASEMKDFIERAKASTLVKDCLSIIKDNPELKVDVVNAASPEAKIILIGLFKYGFDCEKNMHLLEKTVHSNKHKYAAERSPSPPYKKRRDQSPVKVR